MPEVTWDETPGWYINLEFRFSTNLNFQPSLYYSSVETLYMRNNNFLCIFRARTWYWFLFYIGSLTLISGIILQFDNSILFVKICSKWPNFQHNCSNGKWTYQNFTSYKFCWFTVMWICRKGNFDICKTLGCNYVDLVYPLFTTAKRCATPTPPSREISLLVSKSHNQIVVLPVSPGTYYLCLLLHWRTYVFLCRLPILILLVPFYY